MHIDYATQFHELLTANGLLSLLTLTVLEIVLGVDNIIFVSIVAGKLSTKAEQKRARTIGLSFAMLTRIALLFAISWILSLSEPLMTIFTQEFTGKDLILLAGGVFLIVKTVSEIHQKIEGDEEKKVNVKKVAMTSIIIQIVFINLIFSFDSILTAIGVVSNIIIMMAAVIISMGIMMLASERVSGFIEKHPTVKMLALAFLLMIGILLIAEAFHKDIPKEYVYCSMAFAFLVEFLNMRMRKNEQKK
jgi:predicted tellurium resistance membrane protein TerC